MTPFGPSEAALGQAGREFGPHAKPATPSQAAKAADDQTGKTVTMVFPRKVVLTTDDYKRIEFPPGIHEVPASLANHEYLSLNGVSRHQVNAAELPEPSDDDNEEGEEPTIESLSKLTKVDLIKLAKDSYDLDLDPADKKDDMVISIMEAVEKGGQA